MKINGVVFLLLVFNATIVQAQLSLFRDTKGNYGFKDKSGNIAIEPRFLYKPEPFQEGLAVFSKWYNQKGLMDEKGKEIIAPIYSSIGPFKNGLAVVKKEVIDTSTNKSQQPKRLTVSSVIDRNGMEIMQGTALDLYGDYSNGWFILLQEKVLRGEAKRFYIDKAGKNITVPDGMTLLVDSVNGKNFIAIKGGKYGLIDQKFKEVIPFEYSMLRSTEVGMLLATKSNKTGIMNSKFKWIVEPKYTSISLFKGGYAIVTNEEKKVGVINTKGQEIVPLQYKGIRRFSNSPTSIALYKLIDVDREGLLDMATGKIITPAIYTIYATTPSEGTFTFTRDNKKGMMDLTGKELFWAEYDDFSSGFSNNERAWVMKNKKYGFIDKTGKLVVPLEYDMVNGFSEGLARVRLNGKNGYVNTEGVLVIPLIYTDAESFDTGLARVKDENNRSFFIDKAGKEVK